MCPRSVRAHMDAMQPPLPMILTLRPVPPNLSQFRAAGIPLDAPSFCGLDLHPSLPLECELPGRGKSVAGGSASVSRVRRQKAPPNPGHP
jgi:hypothetical protein